MDFKKVRPGDPLRIPAQTFNSILDATQIVRQNFPASRNPGARAIPKDACIIQVQNKTGAAIDQFACVEVDKPGVLPSENENGFKSRITLEVVTPTSSHLPWVIVQEPLAKDAIGPAIAAGCTVCKINLLNVTDTHVDSKSTLLIPQSGSSGPAQILWVLGGVGEGSGTGEQYALIRFGDSSPIRFCRVAQSGGSAGSDSTNCSFTYDLYELNNVTKINTTGGPVTPKNAPTRIPLVTYGAATYGCYGYDADGSFILVVIDEAPGRNDCP